MGRAVVTTIEETPVQAFPDLPGVAGAGAVESRAVISGPERPILLWSHRLGAGAEIHWVQPPVGHAAYVWRGWATVDGQPLAEEGAVIVEHGAEAVLKAGSQGCELLHFHRPADHPQRPSRAGGHTHVINADQAQHYAYQEGVVYADSGCPTCELWLHSNRMPAVTGGAPRHMHTEDEIIVVVGGSMAFGTRELPPGTALAIDANTVYAFTAGKDGLLFVNFRACDPHYIPMSDKGRGEPISEREAVSVLVGGAAAQAALLDKVNMPAPPS